MTKLPLRPSWDKVQLAAGGARAVGVDRATRTINGYVVAQGGAFKDASLGEFDQASLQSIVGLMASSPKGVKSRFSHPSLSNDGLGSFLGRSSNPRLSSCMSERNGVATEVPCVRADLALSATASKNNPNGNLGDYLMDLIEEDSDALSSSLVLRKDTEMRLEKNGTPMLGANGKALPPLWRPKQIYASDIVDEGMACNGVLSASLLFDGELPDEAVRLASDVIDRAFAGQTRDVVSARCGAFLERYLSRRFGDVVIDEPAGTPPGVLLMKLALRERGF